MSFEKVLGNSSAGKSSDANNDSDATEDDNFNYILSAPGLIQTNSVDNKSYFLDNNAQAIFELNTTSGVHNPIFLRYELQSSDYKRMKQLYLCTSQNFGILEVQNTQTDVTEFLKIDLSTKVTSVITSTDSNIAELQFPNGARLDMACENLYILDGGSQSLIRLNLTSSLATLISSNAIGTGGSLFNSPKDIYVDELNDEAYITDYGYFTPFSQGYIFKVNLTTGNKSLFSNYDIGTGTSFIFRNILNIEQFDNNYLYAYAERYIFEVDKTTGDRVVLFDDGDIPGFDIFNYRGFTLDPFDKSFAFLNGGSNSPLIYKMNLTAPSGSLVASGYTASGPNIIKSSSMVVTSDESRIFFSSTYELGIKEVNPQTGNRSITSDNSLGTGPLYDNEDNPQIAITSDDNFIYYFGQKSQYVLKVEIATGNRTIIIDATSSPSFPFATFSLMKLGPTNQYLYFTSQFNDEIYRLDVDNGSFIKIADNSGVGSGVSLCGPKDFTINQSETKLYSFNCSTSGFVEIDLVTLQRTTKTDALLLNFDLDFNQPLVLSTDNENQFIIALNGDITELDATTGNEASISTPYKKGKGNIIPSKINAIWINKDRTYIYVESNGELFKINTKSGNRKILSKWFATVFAS
ncbi:hypothetical protein M899_1444 [Bacteriovorax sp. BSW11_IV]|nr:hypothetical protein M899_1444 [Bacteriovorax sp. BSW11_IV]